MVKLILVALCALLAACGPSCEDQGGTLELQYYLPIVIDGKVIGQTPIFHCEQQDLKHG